MTQVLLGILVVVLTVLTVLVAVLLTKLRALRVMLLNVSTKRDIENLYQQDEAREALYRDLGLTRSLARLRGNAVSPDYLRELSQHIWRRSPQFVVECGSGTTTVTIAKTLQRNGYGHVYSLEHDLETANNTYRQLSEHELTDWATVIHANLVKYTLSGNEYAWYALNDLPKVMFDMLVVDGPHVATQKHARYPALFLLRSRLSDQAIIIANNVNRDDDASTVVRWAHDFPEFKFQRLKCEKGCAFGERADNVVVDVDVLRTNIDVVEDHMATVIPTARRSSL